MKGEQVALVGGLGVLGYLYWKKTQEPPPGGGDPPPGGGGPVLTTLAGTVTNTAGNPVPQVKVSIGSDVRFTDEWGKFNNPFILTGTYTIKFEKPGYETLSRQVTLVTGANTQNAVLVSTTPLPGLATLTGTVKSATTGAAISGAQVDLYIHRAYTDASGRYTIPNIDFTVAPGGGFSIAVSAVGYEFGGGLVVITAGTNTHNLTLTPKAAPPPGPGPVGPNDPSVVSMPDMTASSGSQYWPVASVKLPTVGDAYRLLFEISPLQLNGGYYARVMQFSFTRMGPISQGDYNSARDIKLDRADGIYQLRGQGFNIKNLGGIGDPGLYQAMITADRINSEAGHELMAAEQNMRDVEAAGHYYPQPEWVAARTRLEAASARTSETNQASQDAIDAYYATVTPNNYVREAVPAEAKAYGTLWPSYNLPRGQYQVVGKITQTISGVEHEFDMGTIARLNVT